MTTQTTPEIRSETTKTLFDKFDAIERSLDMARHEIEQGQLTGSALVSLQCDAEELAELCKVLRQLRKAGGAK